MDDNKVIRQLIRVNLELEGFEVVTAADGAECLDVVHQVRPDVITLDVVMPRLDGLRTAALLRADPRTRALPLLIVSACSPREVDADSEVTVDGFLAKPFDPAELVRVVRRLLERGPLELPGLPGVPSGPGGPVARTDRGGSDGGDDLGGMDGAGGLPRLGGLGGFGGLGDASRDGSADGGARGSDPCAGGSRPGGCGGQGPGRAEAAAGREAAGEAEAERAAWGFGV